MFNKALPRSTRNSATQSRNPERTQERILRAAFKEFAANGFAGARVDRIARLAAINKRMLYHYFGDKEALFREVLRRKMAERRAWSIATPNAPSETLPFWFELACRDMDWIRLLEWEALQFAGGKIIDGQRRQRAFDAAVGRVRERQKLGFVSRELSPNEVLLAMVALTWFPLAFPQLTRLLMGQKVTDESFRKRHREFLRKLGAAFQSGPQVHRRRIAIRVNGDRAIANRKTNQRLDNADTNGRRG